MFFGINNKYLKCPSLYLTMLSLFYLIYQPLYDIRYKNFITIILFIILFMEYIVPSDIERILFTIIKNKKRKNNHVKYIQRLLNKNNFYKIFYIFHIPYILIICILLITINQYIPLIFLLLQFVLNYIEIIYIKTLLK